MRTAARSSLTTWLTEVLGPHAVVAVPRQTVGRRNSSQVVVEIADQEGVRWFAKQVATEREWRCEARAYRRWVPALQGLAPRLVALDADRRTLLLSAVPGIEPDIRDADAAHQAGALLRRLHDSVPSRLQPAGAPHRAAARLRQRLSRHPELFSPAETDYALACAAGLESLDLPVRVPCHGDYYKNNWLVDDTGTLRIIDFGHSRWDHPASDFAQLYHRGYVEHPHLATRFLDGYGRPLTDAEATFLRLHRVAHATAELVLGHARDEPSLVTDGRARLADLMASAARHP